MKIDQRIGGYAFIAGIGIAIIGGLANITGGVAVLVLLILGLIVGLLNITVKETTPFLISAIALIVAGGANISILPLVGNLLQVVLNNIVVLVAPAAIVVALKEIYTLASSK